MDERCLSCGRDTAAGTKLFAARRRGLDRETKAEGFLCYACQDGTAVVAPDSAVPLSGRYVVIDLPGGMAGY